MAVDTPQGRYSLLGFGSPTPRLLPIPQGSIEADDRALLLYLYAGLTLAEPAATETNSGGWRRKQAPFRSESDTERQARIKAERVRMGILPPDPAPQPAAGSMAAIFGKPLDLAHNFGEQAPGLAAHLLPEDLAGLEALAARAAQLTVNEEIALWLKLDEARRLNAEWLRDEDDAAVLMLAIATLH